MARASIVILSLIAVMLTTVLALPGGTGHGFTAQARQDNAAADGVEVLLRATLDETLPSPAFFRLLRITLDPGASIPAHTHPGPELDRVEAGTVIVQVEGPALLTRSSSGNATPTPETLNSGELTLESGDQIALPTGSGMGFANTGTESATLLAAVLLPAGSQRPPGVVYTEGTPAPNAFTGVVPRVLGDGVTTVMPTQAAEVVVERLTLTDGRPIPAAPGPVMISVESGALGFTIDEGQVQISRTAQPGPQSDSPAGTAVELAVGDAAFFPIGMAETARPAGYGELVLLRMSVLAVTADAAATPVAGTEGIGALTIPAPPATPVPSPTTVPDEEPTPTAGPGTDTEPGGFAVGSSVVVIESDVRLRSAPSTDAEIVSGLDQGAVLVVTGPPEEGSGLVWYPVVDPNDASLAGFVAEQFLEAQT